MKAKTSTLLIKTIQLELTPAEANIIVDILRLVPMRDLTSKQETTKVDFIKTVKELLVMEDL